MRAHTCAQLLVNSLHFLHSSHIILEEIVGTGLILKNNFIGNSVYIPSKEGEEDNKSGEEKKSISVNNKFLINLKRKNYWMKENNDNTRTI